MIDSLGSFIFRNKIILMKHIFTIVCITFVSFLCFTSCMEEPVNEGTITYKITYKEEEKEAMPIIDLLPNEMTQYFKNESSKSMIEGFMGMFMAAYISNNETKENTVLFKVMTDKHFCMTLFGEPSVGFDEFPGMKIEHTKETKVIAGKNATKAIVTFENEEMPSFDIYYTDEIKITNPNWHTPYKDIDKVLLDFVVRLKGITLHVEATNVTNEPIDDSEFNIPEDFQRVDEKELNRRIIDIIENANY